MKWTDLSDNLKIRFTFDGILSLSPTEYGAYLFQTMTISAYRLYRDFQIVLLELEPENGETFKLACDFYWLSRFLEKATTTNNKRSVIHVSTEDTEDM